MDIKIKHKKYKIPRKYWKWIICGFALAGLIPFLVLSDFSSTMNVDRKGLSIGNATSGQFNDYISVDGQVIPIQVVQISPEEGGIVTEKVVDEGAHVHKGDIILRLSNSSLDLGILNAESELAEKQDLLRNTQINMAQEQLSNSSEEVQLAQEVKTKLRSYQHKKALFKEQLISHEDELKAQEDYQLAVKKYALIRQRLSKSRQLRQAQSAQMNDNLAAMEKNLILVRQRKEKLNVRSGIDGEVGTLNVELGQSISPGQNVGAINDLSNYKVEAQIDENYIDRVHQGLSARFEQNGRSYKLTVQKVYPDVKDGRFKVDFIFRGARPDHIRTGQTYYINLQLGESRKAVLLPKGSFYGTTGGSWIFVLDASGRKAYRRNISIGRQNPQYYEVLSGLQPGERVILSGYEEYKDNKELILK